MEKINKRKVNFEIIATMSSENLQKQKENNNYEIINVVRVFTTTKHMKHEKHIYLFVIKSTNHKQMYTSS